MKRNQTIAMWFFIFYFFLLIMLSFGPLKDVTIGDNYTNISKSLGIIDYTSNAQAGASISEILNSGYTTSVNFIAFGSYLLFGLVISFVIFFTGRNSN